MDFWERINQGVIVADGAMGTMLYDLGVPKGHCYDELNLSNPEIIHQIHKAYADAGADLIETNTFGANAYILGKYYDLAKKAQEINIQGAQIAKNAAQKKIFVAGAVGPITRPLETAERLSLSEIHELFTKQIEALVIGGVDVIILETMASVDELLTGFRAARKVCDLPVICQLSFSTDGRTILGTDPVQAAAKLEASGVQIMGANCGIGPQSVYESIQRMGHVTHAFLSAQPNAGQASWARGKFIYPATPQYFAEYAKKYANVGVSIIGGCCGSTPEHIKAVKSAVAHLHPKPRKIVHLREPHKAAVRKPLKTSTLAPEFAPTHLQQKLKEKFVMSLEIDPPRGWGIENEIRAAKKFKELGGDSVNISDSPMARLRMSPIPLAHAIKESLGIDVILHFTCRDRNLLAIQSDLIGVHALGIRNILALTGDPPSVGDYPFATAVFEVKSEGLIEIIDSLNRGRDWLGNPITQQTSFFVGIGSKLDEQERTKKKIALGAQFIQTQPVFDIGEIQKFVHALPNIPVIAGILVLANLRHAMFIKNEVPGITIPDTIIQRMEKGMADEGILIARELLQGIKDICQGVCLMLPHGKYELTDQILEGVAL